jgi:hypothetical protein
VVAVVEVVLMDLAEVVGVRQREVEEGVVALEVAPLRMVAGLIRVLQTRDMKFQPVLLL